MCLRAFVWRQHNAAGAVETLHPWLWTAHPDRPAFWWVDGVILVKNPDERTILKMVALARQLHARVLGDEQEEYGPDGKPLPPPPPPSLWRTLLDALVRRVRSL